MLKRLLVFTVGACVAGVLGGWILVNEPSRLVGLAILAMAALIFVCMFLGAFVLYWGNADA